MASLVETAYSILGVSRDSTATEIQTAWRLVARRTHPDRPGGTHDDFAKASEAYSTLSGYYSRKVYDSRLILENDICPRCEGGGRTYKQKGFTERVPKICSTCNGSGVVARATRSRGSSRTSTR